MNRHDGSHEKLRGGNRRLLPILAFVAAAALSIQCDAKLAEFFGLIDDGLVPGQGDIVGRVTVDGSGRSGITVTLRQGGFVVDTSTTDSNGDYEFLNLDPGTYTVLISSISGANCPGEQTATVVADDETEVNFPCTTSPPATGTVTGGVTLEGSPPSGVTVELRQGTTIVDTELTNASGNFTFPNVTTGTYTVRITRPANTACDGTVVNGSNEKPATVSANQTTTVNFACTLVSLDYTVSLTNPPPGWNHTMPGIESVECKVITTNPPQPGASFFVQVTGPGVIPGQTVAGTLNSSGAAAFQVRINQTGTYTNLVTVVSGPLHDVVRTGTANVTVTGSSNTCPLAPSSQRFKRGVTSLLPDGATLLGLRPVAFRYRAPYGDPAIPQVGLIAEEVVRVFPAAVTLGADGRAFGIQYGTLTGLVIGEVEARARRSVEAGIARLAEALE